MPNRKQTLSYDSIDHFLYARINYCNEFIFAGLVKSSAIESEACEAMLDQSSSPKP